MGDILLQLTVVTVVKLLYHTTSDGFIAFINHLFLLCFKWVWQLGQIMTDCHFCHVIYPECVEWNAFLVIWIWKVIYFDYFLWHMAQMNFNGKMALVINYAKTDSKNIKLFQSANLWFPLTSGGEWSVEIFNLFLTFAGQRIFRSRCFWGGEKILIWLFALFFVT